MMMSAENITEVRFDRFLSPTGGTAAIARFSIDWLNAKHHFDITLTQTLGNTSKWRMTPDECEKVLFRFAFQSIENELNLGQIANLDQQIVLTTTNMPDPGHLRLRLCDLSIRKSRGLICSAQGDKDYLDGQTTTALCQTCNLPDTDLLCSHLVHIKVSAPADKKKRRVEWAICDKGEQFELDRVGECLPGKKQCWEKLFIAKQVKENMPDDLPAALIDELDFCNLAFKEVYKKRLIEPKQFRSTKYLITDCPDHSEFMLKVAALADLVGQFSTNEVLSKKHEEKAQGTVSALDRLMALDYKMAGSSAIRRLRFIIDLRNSFPIHTTSKDLISACRGLGFDYPPTSWTEAWQKVLFAFYTTIKEIREILMTGKP